jgi:hypothetical protein
MASLLATWALISASGRFFGRDGRFFGRDGRFFGEISFLGKFTGHLRPRLGAFFEFPFWESSPDVDGGFGRLFSNFLFGNDDVSQFLAGV